MALAVLAACGAPTPSSSPTPPAAGLAATIAAGGTGLGAVTVGTPRAGADIPTPVPTATPTLIPPKPTVTPTPKPPTTTPVPAPRTMEIPKIGLAAPIKGIGTRPTGEMDAPSSPTDVGWFIGGPKPGDAGNAILTGHLDWAGPPLQTAVFFRLKELLPGDPIHVNTEVGRLTFAVEHTWLYPRADAPVDRILGFALGRVITLVTCEGTFIPGERDYTHRRVVRARLT